MQGTVYFKTESGRKLVGVIDRGENTDSSQPAIIILGAFNSYKYSFVQEELSKFFIELGFATFRFDYMGRGESEGDISHATISTGVEDTKAAYDFIKNQLWSDANDISVFAFGIGAAYAIAAKGTEAKYKFLIMSNPRAESITFYDGVDLEEWRKNEYYYTRGLNHHISIYDDTQKYNIYKLAKNLKTKVLIINSKGEETYINGQDRRLAEETRNVTYELIDNEERVFSATNKEPIIKIISEWLDKKCLITKKQETTEE